jgi:hypothetical protein
VQAHYRRMAQAARTPRTTKRTLHCLSRRPCLHFASVRTVLAFFLSRGRAAASAFLGRLFSRSSALSPAREDPADALECEIPPTSHPALRLAPTAVPSSASAAIDEGWRCGPPAAHCPRRGCDQGARRAETQGLQGVSRTQASI